MNTKLIPLGVAALALVAVLLPSVAAAGTTGESVANAPFPASRSRRFAVRDGLKSSAARIDRSLITII